MLKLRNSDGRHSMAWDINTAMKHYLKGVLAGSNLGRKEKDIIISSIASENLPKELVKV